MEGKKNRNFSTGSQDYPADPTPHPGAVLVTNIRTLCHLFQFRLILFILLYKSPIIFIGQIEFEMVFQHFSVVVFIDLKKAFDMINWEVS